MSLNIDSKILFRTAECGSDAMEEVRSGAAFDLIVSDAMLPDMSGVALLRRLFVDVGSTAPPVVMLTALRWDQELDRLADAGAIAVISKPFDPLILADQLRHHLDHRNRPCLRWWTAAQPDRRS
ncbi:response regulator [Sphingomonas sp. PAMC 26617]|uniref:response regulator n=1 Tax=Sphingomonas sp. PAMC 26617 TaxID=1112216 RepID=UPI000288B010